MSDGEFAYRFADSLPLNPVPAGTNVLIAGPADGGARALSLAMLDAAPGTDQGMIITAVDRDPQQLSEELQGMGVRIGRDLTRIIDCVSHGATGTFPARVRVSKPEDLAGIGKAHSALYRGLGRDGIERVRNAVVSVSALLTAGSFKPVARFVHMLAERITTNEGFGVFLVDTQTHDERVYGAFEAFCDGRVDVAAEDSTWRLRSQGLPNQPQEWTTFAH